MTRMTVMRSASVENTNTVSTAPCRYATSAASPLMLATRVIQAPGVASTVRVTLWNSENINRPTASAPITGRRAADDLAAAICREFDVGREVLFEAGQIARPQRFDEP